MMTPFKCKVCDKIVQVHTREGDGIWTVFCSPEHMREWQAPRTQNCILEETSGFGMPYDRCQWCSATLKSGYHNDSCPVRKLECPSAPSKGTMTGKEFSEVVRSFEEGCKACPQCGNTKLHAAGEYDTLLSVWCERCGALAVETSKDKREFKWNIPSEVLLNTAQELVESFGPRTALAELLKMPNATYAEIVVAVRDLQRAGHKLKRTEARSDLTTLLEIPEDTPYAEIVVAVRDLKRQAEHKLKVENVIQVLRGIDVLTGVMDRIEIQLSDEAVYEHLKTCADVLDDEDQKRMLRDAAELFADEFCNEGTRKP